LAALNPNNTPRFFWKYRTSNVGIEHTVMVRPADITPTPRIAAEETLRQVLEALGSSFFRNQWRVFEGAVAAAGADFTAALPFIAGLNNFVGSNVTTYNPDREAVEMRFVGRSPETGRKVSFSLYGVRGNLSVGTFRLNGAASGDGLLVRNAVAVLNNSQGAFRCIDGTIPVWYDYVNLQYNSYWERRIRVGG
jgi:hypothetical protein